MATAAATKLKDEGNAQLKAGRAVDASASYSKAIALTPHNPVLYGNRAAARLQSGAFPAALRDAQRCAALQPTYLKAYSRMSSAYVGMGRVLSALDACTAALQVMEEEPEETGAKPIDRQYFAGEAARLRGVAAAATAAAVAALGAGSEEGGAGAAAAVAGTVAVAVVEAGAGTAAAAGQAGGAPGAGVGAVPPPPLPAGLGGGRGRVAPVASVHARGGGSDGEDSVDGRSGEGSGSEDGDSDGDPGACTVPSPSLPPGLNVLLLHRGAA
jgi:hypothetical protein